MHLFLLLVGIGAVLLALFGQGFLSDFPLVLPPLCQVFQKLRLLTLFIGRKTKMPCQSNELLSLFKSTKVTAFHRDPF